MQVLMVGGNSHRRTCESHTGRILLMLDHTVPCVCIYTVYRSKVYMFVVKFMTTSIKFVQLCLQSVTTVKHHRPPGFLQTITINILPPAVFRLYLREMTSSYPTSWLVSNQRKHDQTDALARELSNSVIFLPLSSSPNNSKLCMSNSALVSALFGLLSVHD